jgi:hypothetical protein
LNAYQAARAEIRINALTSDEFDTFSSLLNSAATDMEYAFCAKPWQLSAPWQILLCLPTASAA